MTLPYNIYKQDGSWKRDVTLKYGSAFMIVSAIGNALPNVEVMYAKSSQQLSDTNYPQRLENAKRSAIDFFQRLEPSAGFSNA